ncbi:hypothetical protein [Microbaculum sp. FT89]
MGKIHVTILGLTGLFVLLRSSGPEPIALLLVGAAAFILVLSSFLLRD